MKVHKMLFTKLILPVIACVWSIAGFAQKANVDLAKLVVGKTIKAYNREVTIVSSETMGAQVHLSEQSGPGVAWLEGIQFTDGVIEFEVKGRNVMQKSFVGIAFHGSNDSTYDAIYFRPFNFKSPEEERRNHSVQYVSLPKYDWPKLRSEFPNKYEQPISPSPEPEEWIHCRVVVKNEEVSLFVNNNPIPSLVVKALSSQKGNKVGFWVGNGSDGDFAKFSSNP